MNHINQQFERVPSDLVQRAAQYPAAIWSDIAGRRGAMHGRIAALNTSMQLAGPALTVDVRPGDNLMIHAALALAKPGDVLVIDAKGDQTSAVMGAIMMTAAKKLGLGGVVVDAAVRDRLEIEALGFAVFSVGTNPNGPSKSVGGRIGHAVTCGGVVVHAGDLVVADADGVVVVERSRVADLLPAAAKKVADEAKRMEQIAAGNTQAPWLQAALVAAGVLADGQSL